MQKNQKCWKEIWKKLRLSGKATIVTGAGGKIGHEIVLALAKEGANVAACDLAYEQTVKAAEDAKVFGGQALAIKVDVTKSAEVNQMVEKTLKNFGKIDILVNSAGIVRIAKVVDMKEQEWDAIFAVNAKGTFLCSKAVAPHMMKQKSGKIINISSGAGKQGRGIGLAHYSASKFAVIGFTQCLALELAPYNINVNAVCPGIVDTPMWREYNAPALAKLWGVTAEEAFQRAVKERIPLGRPQTPEDIGNLVVFLASKESESITGQSISVDGGQHFD